MLTSNSKLRCVTGLFIIFFFAIPELPAQSYTKAAHLNILPSQVLIYQYSMINLPEHAEVLAGLNRFDPANPYTYIQVVQDKYNSAYHILYQTNFVGKLLYLACSNDLMLAMDKKDKQLQGFRACIYMVNSYVMATQNADIAITCLLNRLNEGIE